MLLFGFVMIGAAAVFTWLFLRKQTAEAVTTDGGVFQMPHGTLSGTFLPDEEVSVIHRIATEYGIDARLLAAIRKAEMGGPGREFGVLSENALTYDAQARVTAQSILNNQSRYETATGRSATSGGRFTRDFIAFMANRWAPLGAENDPQNLNVNWANNVTSWYGRIDYA